MLPSAESAKARNQSLLRGFGFGTLGLVLGAGITWLAIASKTNIPSGDDSPITIRGGSIILRAHDGWTSCYPTDPSAPRSNCYFAKMDHARKTKSLLLDQVLNQTNVSQKLAWEIDLPDRSSGHGVIVCADVKKDYSGCLLTNSASSSDTVYVLSMDPGDTLSQADLDDPSAVTHRLQFKEGTGHGKNHIAKNFRIKVDGSSSDEPCHDGACFIYFPQ